MKNNGNNGHNAKMGLAEYTEKLGLRPGHGVIDLRGKTYVTVAGLRVLAVRSGVQSIVVNPVYEWCQPEKGLFYMQAEVVYPDGRTFVEYGCSDGSGVGRSGVHALMAHASTRAVGRALRMALDVDLPLLEESAPAVQDAHRAQEGASQPRQATSKAKATPTPTPAPSLPEFTAEKMEEWKKTADAASSMTELNLWADALKEMFDAFAVTDHQRGKLRAHYVARQSQIKRAVARRAYFAELSKTPFTKEDSDAAIRTAYGVESHNELSSPQLEYMRRQLQVSASDVPPVTHQPGSSAMFRVHLEWAFNEAQKA